MPVTELRGEIRQTAGPAGGDPGRTALPVAAEDERAERVVRAPVEGRGFDTVDAGGAAPPREPYG